MNSIYSQNNNFCDTFSMLENVLNLKQNINKLRFSTDNKSITKLKLDVLKDSFKIVYPRYDLTRINAFIDHMKFIVEIRN